MLSDDMIPADSDAPVGDSPQVPPPAPQALDEPTAAAPGVSSEPLPTEEPKRKLGRPRKAAAPAEQGGTGRPTAPAAPLSAHLTDALDVLGGSTARATPPARPSVIAVDANEKLFVPFTTMSAPVAVHYIDGQTFRGYVRCSGSGCLPCRLGRRADQRLLVPVYDPIAQRVAVLPLPTAMRPGGLGPQIRPLLARVKNGEVFMVGVRRQHDFAVVVAEYPVPDDADIDFAVIKAFVTELEAGRIDLTSVYPTMTAGDIASVPELAAVARLRGVQL